MKKVSFPRITLPVILVLTSLINFAIIFGLFLIFLVLIGDFRFMQLLLMVPVVLTTLALAAGLTMVLAVLNVFFPRYRTTFYDCVAVLVLVYPNCLSITDYSSMGKRRSGNESDGHNSRQYA